MINERLVVTAGVALVASCVALACTPAPRGPGSEFPIPGTDSAGLARFHLDVPALPAADTGICRVSPGRAGGTYVGVSAPGPLERRATDLVEIDSTGRVVLFVHERHSRPAPNGPYRSRAEGDSVLAAAARVTRTSRIHLDYRAARAWVTNRGAGGLDNGVSVPLPVIAHDPRFGRPVDRVEAILRRCGTEFRTH